MRERIGRRCAVAVGRTGFSLVELLVVVGILAALAALLLPAVQNARETARRSQCQNNLRQIGLALAMYHEVLESLPMGGIEWRPPTSVLKWERNIAWSALILPYLEQRQLHEAINFERPFDATDNTSAASAVIAAYLCPSSRRSRHVAPKRGPSDYGGIFGERITSANQPPKGTMLYDRAIRYQDVTDGLSKTIVIGEDSKTPDGEWINGYNVFDQSPFPINKAPPIENDLSSEHRGGVFVLFADDSVRFLDENTSPRIVAAICTRAGNERLDGF